MPRQRVPHYFLPQILPEWVLKRLEGKSRQESELGFGQGGSWLRGQALAAPGHRGKRNKEQMGKVSGTGLGTE